MTKSGRNDAEMATARAPLDCAHGASAILQPPTRGSATTFGRFAAHLGALFFPRRNAAAIQRMARELAARSAQLAEAEAAFEHSRLTFERAAAAANCGMWECSLPDNRLNWSSGTYDIFGLAHDHVLDRRETLEFYTRSSVATLAAVRGRAIETRRGFTLDSEIVTPAGLCRWVRITASVDCENDAPSRLFGMKQDITEEKLLWEQTRRLAESDALTGLSNRGRFDARLADLCAEPVAGDTPGALLVVDLDGFKGINDRYGHAAGDECLKEAARRLVRVCGDADLVARIGGDEFAVLIGHGQDIRIPERLAGRIVEALGEPVRYDGQDFALGASVGLAWAGSSAADLYARADAALYAAKGSGRNTFRAYEPPVVLYA